MASQVIYKSPWNFQLEQVPQQVRSFEEVNMLMRDLYKSLTLMQVVLGQQAFQEPVIFGANVGFGKLVNLYNDAGVLKARLAAAATNRPAHGFCNAPNGVLLGATGFVQLGGAFLEGLTGLTIGAPYYLGAAGGLSLTPSVGAGTTEQYVGIALAADRLAYGAYPWITH